MLSMFRAGGIVTLHDANLLTVLLTPSPSEPNTNSKFSFLCTFNSSSDISGVTSSPPCSPTGRSRSLSALAKCADFGSDNGISSSSSTSSSLSRFDDPSSLMLVDMILNLYGPSLASWRNRETYLAQYRGRNSRAPLDTLLTVGVSPHASFRLTIMPSTPMNMADLKMLPKFCGSVIPSRNR